MIGAQNVMLDVVYGDGETGSYYISHKGEDEGTAAGQGRRRLIGKREEACQTSVEVEHAYRSDGHYTVMATLDNGQGGISASLILLVYTELSGPALHHTAVVSTNTSALFTLTFQAHSLNVTYVWSVWHTEQREVHQEKHSKPELRYIFTEDGLYTVKVNASNALNWVATESVVQVEEAIQHLKVMIRTGQPATEDGLDQCWGINENANSTLNEGLMNGSCLLGDPYVRTGDTVVMNASVISGTAVSFRWEIHGVGRGETLADYHTLWSQANHTFLTRGTYSITVIARNTISVQTVVLPYSIEVQEPVANLYLPPVPTVTCGNVSMVTASVTKGRPVLYDIEHLGVKFKMIDSQPVFPDEGLYHVTVHAYNNVSEVKEKAEVQVQCPFPDIDLLVPHIPHKVGEYIGMAVRIEGKLVINNIMVY